MSFRDEVPLYRPGRSLTLALALGVVLGARTAGAQTVIIQSAPAGAAIDVTFNGTSVATAKADAEGDATLSAGANRPDTDILIFIDSCADRVRVQLAARGLQPAAALPGCSRVDANSMFMMRSVTTFVIDITPNVSVHVAQGPPPPEWLLRGPGAVRKSTMMHGTPPKGLVLSAGVGGSSFGSIADQACGDVAQCLNTHAGVAFALDAEYWITRFMAAQVGFFQPADVTVNGAPTGYTFDTRVQTRLLTIVGKGGVSVGSARFYGLGGANHHEATFNTTQTISDKTITVNGVNQVVPGGTQSFGQKTSGWSWIAGGGVEGWINNWIGIFGEVDIAQVEGSPVVGTGDGIDEQMRMAFFGIRVHIGR
ncbi:MAG TPA: hypothetical protein VH497_12025 [Vicinamibacterales bacterium]|jgi:hypothetical protein